MGLVLQLPPELERRLAEEAARRGLPLKEYALQLLTARLARPTRLRGGAALVAYWQREGLIGTRNDIEDAPTQARVLREQAQQRLRRSV